MSRKGQAVPFDFGKMVPAAQIEDIDDEDDENEKFMEELPKTIKRRVFALENIHKDHVALEKKYRDEVAELERKYSKMYAPLYAKRATIVNGEYEPTDAEVTIEGRELGDVKGKDEKGIPNFWLRVMQNNSKVGSTVTEDDEPCLAYLRDVRCENFEEGKHGFSLAFHFAENPFFSNAVLTKTYHLAEDDSMYGELVFDRAEGCEINWKPKKKLTVKLVEVKQKARAKGGKGRGGGGAVKTVTKEEECDSFFHFFNAPDRAASEEEDPDGLMDDLLEADFEMGCIFKDKLIPHSVMWYTGEAFEYDEDYDDFGDEFGDDDDDDLEDDDSEEEEDEEPRRGGRGGGAPKGGRGGKMMPPPAGGKGAPGQQPAPECKQQ